jgi:protein involved in ribonucleotide reduction
MNRIQQDSLAEALGMSRDEMGDMLKQQEQYSKFGATNRKQLLEQVDLLRKGGKEQEAIAKAGGEAAYNDLVRASAQEKLALFIEKIKQSIVEFVEKTNIIDKIENFVNMLSNPGTIKGIIGTIKNVIASFIEIAGNLIADVVEGVGWLKNFFTSGKEGDLAEARAMQTAAGIRSGAATMSGNLRGTGIEYKGEEIGTNAATSQTAGAGAAAAAASTSMAKPQNVQFNVTTYVKDTKKDATARMDISPNSDVQTGKGN